ncbi:MAG: hypothetical protein MI923_25890 [Phycisphaerales bacterium]|nr:hypothetical protein [Phycisphaerales bacterium]
MTKKVRKEKPRPCRVWFYGPTRQLGRREHSSEDVGPRKEFGMLVRGDVDTEVKY